MSDLMKGGAGHEEHPATEEEWGEWYGSETPKPLARPGVPAGTVPGRRMPRHTAKPTSPRYWPTDRVPARRPPSAELPPIPRLAAAFSSARTA